MKRLFAVLLCLGFVGCTTAPTLPTFNNAYQNQQENTVNYTNYQSDGYNLSAYIYKDYEIDIISDPPGAKIEWNNEYIGETPCKKIINGSLSMINYSYLVQIVANPVIPGQFVQTKVLVQDPLPRTIYFNMTLGPATPAVDVNVNQGNQ